MTDDSTTSAPESAGLAPPAAPRAYFIARTPLNAVGLSDLSLATLSDPRTPGQLRGLVLAQPLLPLISKQKEIRLTIAEAPSPAHLRQFLTSPAGVTLLDNVRTVAPGAAWAATGVAQPPEPFSGPPQPRIYVLTRFKVENPERMEAFRKLVMRLFDARRGRYLVRADPAECLSGPADGNVMSIVEFSSLELVMSGLNSDDFRDMTKVGVGVKYQAFWIVKGEPS